MQLGSRFSIGQTPRSIPHELALRINEVEQSLTDDERATLRWTLTWLENRPVVELDNGVILRG
jgi:hypothetical protein